MTRMKHISMSYLTYQWAMSHTNEARIHEWVMSHMNKSCRTEWQRLLPLWIHGTHEWVMTHINWCAMSHINEFLKHIWMSNVTYPNEAWIYEWVMAHMNESRHILMSHVTQSGSGRRHLCLDSLMCAMSHVKESWITYEWVMSHMNESCHTDWQRQAAFVPRLHMVY